MTALVRLAPPYSRGDAGHGFAYGKVPLTAAPPLLRTRGMGRWHRSRSGYSWVNPWGSRRTPVTLWCGQHIVDMADALRRDTLPGGEPLCGTCEGRAVGAGMPATGDPIPSLIHQPRSLAPAPDMCPLGGHRPYPLDGWPDHGFTCPLCGATTKLRGAGGAYNLHVVVERHLTGPRLVDGCPFHRWDRMRVDPIAGTALCACRIPQPERVSA